MAITKSKKGIHAQILSELYTKITVCDENGNPVAIITSDDCEVIATGYTIRMTPNYTV